MLQLTHLPTLHWSSVLNVATVQLVFSQPSWCTFAIFLGRELNFKWKIPHRATVHRNKVSFLVGLDLHKVIIIARPTYFEVQYECSVSQSHTPVHMVCLYIYKTILNGLAVVIRSRNYTYKTTPLVGFYCPRPQCTPTPHIALCEGENPLVMECISSKEPIWIAFQSLYMVWNGNLFLYKYTPML